MLRTFVTERWGLRYPIIGAPMANVARGRLARAITEAGGLGMIGVGNKDTPEFIEREAAVARGDGAAVRFGIGLTSWVVRERPGLLDAAIAQEPFLVSISFGPVQPSVERLKAAGIRVAAQVNSRRSAMDAAGAGVDLVVAQGTEAGGHTGTVSTLPLLQAVLDAVDVPVAAAGGIASPRGMAGVLAAGAEAAWVGTAFLLCPESDVTAGARERIRAAAETDTILTTVFDAVNRLGWPREFPGRTLRNAFAERWHGRERELLSDPEEVARFRAGAEARDYDVTSIFAGQAVGLMRGDRPAREVVEWLGTGGEEAIRGRLDRILGGDVTAREMRHPGK